MYINSRYVSYKNRIMNLMIASNIFLAGAYVCPPFPFHILPSNKIFATLK